MSDINNKKILYKHSKCVNRKCDQIIKDIFMYIILLFSLAYAPVISAEKTLKLSSIKGAYIQRISEAVLKQAYARLGIEFETSWQPAERALKSVVSGATDGEVSRVAAVAKLYPDLIKVNVPVNYLEGMVFSKNTELVVSDWESLRSYKIGINRGIKFAEKGTKGMNVEVANSFKSLFMLLDKDRVEVIVSPKIIGLYQVISLNLKNIKVVEPAIIELKQYHYLNKRHANLAVRIEAVLKDMQEKGEIAAIRAEFVKELMAGTIRK